ncbi:MAG: hypothetical protein WBP64_01620 [Nitrososphaeraceae archaeon]
MECKIDDKIDESLNNLIFISQTFQTHSSYRGDHDTTAPSTCVVDMSIDNLVALTRRFAILDARLLQ